MPTARQKIQQRPHRITTRVTADTMVGMHQKQPSDGGRAHRCRLKAAGENILKRFNDCDSVGANSALWLKYSARRSCPASSAKRRASL